MNLIYKCPNHLHLKKKELAQLYTAKLTNPKRKILGFGDIIKVFFEIIIFKMSTEISKIINENP
jgi:hypothetical protein